MILRKLISIFILLLVSSALHAQTDTTKSDPDETPLLLNDKSMITLGTFKSTRLINTHTLETVGRRTLDFRISHRFGPVNSGVDNWWGLDGGANIRLGLEYSYDGRLMVGIGRTSYQKMVDGFLKYRLLRQRDNNGMPLSVTVFASAYFTHQKDAAKEITGIDRYKYEANRLSYVYQAIIGRKFSNSFSFQLTPYFVHYNLVERITDKNDMYGVAGGLRWKFTKRAALTAEYCYTINDYSRETYYDNFAIGIDIETGGHVFQMHFVNSFGILENQFIPYTQNKWDDAGIRLGFNISRVFTL